MLRIEGLASGYGATRVIENLTMTVERDRITCLIGPNGAGKTTLARTISGMLRSHAGVISLDGKPITNARPEHIVKLGMVQVFEGRELFPKLSVRQNLLLGCFSRYREMGGRGRAAAFDLVHELFPILADRSAQMAGTLSGGEQQMLAIGRALMSRPRLLVLDEPSLGLAPIVIRDIYDVLRRLSAAGLTILLIEEDPQRGLSVAEHGYVLVGGEVSAQGRSDELRDNPELELAYLGRT